MSESQDQPNQAPPPIEPPPPITPPPSANPLPNPESTARTWNMLCHLSALAGFTAIPFANILGPLLVWQIKRNEIPSVDIHGKAALNFQITVTLAVFVSAAAGFALSVFCMGYIFIPLAFAIWLAGIILAVIAGIKANNGEEYKYPWSIEFVK